MKKYKKIFIIAITILCNLTACNENYPITEQRSLCDQGLSFAIIKFKNDDYKNYIMVTKDRFYYDTVPYYHLPICPCMHFEYIKNWLGNDNNIPYIKLPNGYYLTDWKWGGRMISFIAAQPLVVIDAKWNELTSVEQQWLIDSTKVISDKPFEEIYHTGPELLDKYYGMDIKSMIPDTLKCISSNFPWVITKEFYDEYGNIVLTFDEAFAIYDSIAQIYQNKIIELMQTVEITKFAKETDLTKFY